MVSFSFQIKFQLPEGDKCSAAFEINTTIVSPWLFDSKIPFLGEKVNP